MGREIVTTPAAHGVPYDDFTIASEDGERYGALSRSRIQRPELAAAEFAFRAESFIA